MIPDNSLSGEQSFIYWLPITDRARRHIYPLCAIVWLLFIAMLILSRGTWYLSASVKHVSVTCPMVAVLGIPCPNCFLTRAFLFILHGHYRESLRYHYAAIPLFFLYWVQLIYSTTTVILQKQLKVRFLAMRYRIIEKTMAGIYLLAWAANLIRYIYRHARDHSMIEIFYATLWGHILTGFNGSIEAARRMIESILSNT